MREVTIADFKIQTTIVVQWGEMDAYQHVNNVNYVRWGETARVDYFRAMGFIINQDPKKMLYAPILGFQSVKYIAPVVYPDTIIIGTKTDAIKDDRFVLKSYFFSNQQNRLVAIQTHEVVIVDYNKQQKIAIPQSIMDEIHQIEN
ncbi:acyl-CoA thioesterase [Gelidibacter japonicus]|jgi:acyl-CoA thioester hydrolase|uniref:acyl-CoA thioesterase n=1 Tax=Gelidibacter japonicus TaxID=1962232 RepID=UPI0013D3E5AF|nr:thioesterase family protein [Gelidibacter japonicus]